MLAVVCPGQGAQSPGMLAPWLELPGVLDQLDAFSQSAGMDLGSHGTTSDADTIRDTAIAQPLIVATSLLSWRAIDPHRTTGVGVTAGHSVGEFTASAVAGVFDDSNAVGLVAQRAALMARAAAATPTGMSAVVGGDQDTVLAAIDACGLWPANINGGGQIVAAGTRDDLHRLAENPPQDARVIPLNVAGAFHTPYMSEAMASFHDAAEMLPAAAPTLRLLSNADGRAYGDTNDNPATGAAVLRRLVAQIAAPVRWDLCQASCAELGVTGLLELAPGGVLAGLARRCLPGVERLALKSPNDIDAARDLIARHGSAS